MNSILETRTNDTSMIAKLISWLFGVAVLAAGVINTFWGEPVGFGIFLVLLSLVYFVPVNSILKRLMGFSIPKIGILKLLLGVFIIWAAVGVGELFDKIELMKIDL